MAQPYPSPSLVCLFQDSPKGFRTIVMPEDKPKVDPDGRSQIEELLSLCRLRSDSSRTDIFHNKQPLQRPLWARGAYGGQIVAQSLLAAHETVEGGFVVHSIHCHFLRAARPDLSTAYRVDRMRDGKSFANRVVYAEQNNQLVFMATASFTRGSTQGHTLQHAVPIPREERPPEDHPDVATQSAAGQGREGQPCDCVRSALKTDGPPHTRRFRQWIRARGQIGEKPLQACGAGDGTSSPSTAAGSERRDNHHAHLAALAYMTDNYFIGTAFRAHSASRFSNRSFPYPMPPESNGNAVDAEAGRMYFDALAEEETHDNGEAPDNDKHVSMVASLDHTIYFHRPLGFRADAWLLAEMECPWADDERGVVVERVWNHEGVLVATCIQEGVVRLSPQRSKNKL